MSNSDCESDVDCENGNGSECYIPSVNEFKEMRLNKYRKEFRNCLFDSHSNSFIFSIRIQDDDISDELLSEITNKGYIVKEDYKGSFRDTGYRYYMITIESQSSDDD